MKNKWIITVFAALLFVGCGRDGEGLNVTPSQLYGTWQKNNTQEYWKYNSDGSGAKWDVTDGFSEDFPSYSYHWSVSGDQLSYTTFGENIDVPITRTYTITEIDANRMVREEEIGVYTLTKIAK